MTTEAGGSLWWRRVVRFVRREHPPVPSLGYHLWRAVANALSCTAALGAAFIVIPEVGAAFTEHDLVFPERPNKGASDGAEVEVAPVEAKARRLLDKHGCWTGGADDPPRSEQVPGGVVVLKPGAGMPSYGRGPMVTEALHHVFKDETEGLVVYGFCP